MNNSLNNIPGITWFILIAISFLSQETSNAQSLSYDSFFDLSDEATPAVPFSVSDEDSEPRDIVFNDTGTRMFVVGSENDQVFQYDLSTAFDVTSAQFNEESFDISNKETNPQGLTFNNNGSRMYIVGIDMDTVFQYSLSTNFDVTTATLDAKLKVADEEMTPSSIRFNSTGSKMFITGFSGVAVDQYDLSTPFDVTTAVYYDTYDLSDDDTSPRGITFSNNGFRMFIAGNENDNVYQYDLLTAFDVTTASLTHTFDVSGEEGGPQGVAFNSDGSAMFIVGDGGDEVNQYNIGIGGFTEVSANDGSVEGSMAIYISGETFTNAGGTLTENTDYTISKLTSGLIPTLTVSGDGASAILTLGGNAIGHQVAHDVTNLKFTFENSAFSGGDASVVANSGDASSNIGIKYENNPVLSYGHAFDLENGAGLNSPKFSVNSEHGDPQGIAISTDGTKIFIVGGETTGSNEVNQYTLATPFDITSGITFDGNPFGLDDSKPLDLTFKPDGSKMYIVGDNNNQIYQYTLSNPFDITSGASHDGSAFHVGGQDTYLQAMAFSLDGLKMFVVGSTNDRVYQYNLSIPYDITTGVSYDGSFSISGQIQTPTGIAFSRYGTKMFITGTTNNVYAYSLSNPFDITSGASYDNFAYYLGSDKVTTGLTFSADGSKMYIVSPYFDDDAVYQYSLNVDSFSESTLNDGSVDGSMDIAITGDTFTNAGSNLTETTDYTIHDLPSGLTPTLSVAGDGLSATLTFDGQATDHLNENDIKSLEITFENPAFSSGNASAVFNTISANSNIGIDFTENPKSCYALTGNGQVQINWTSSTHVDITDYRIYRELSGEAPVVVTEITKTGDGTDTLFVDLNVTNGELYLYHVVGLDASENEIPLTNEDDVPLTAKEGAVPNESFGNAVSFDGEEDFIEIVNDDLLKNDQGTLDFWVKLDTDPSGNAYSFAGKHRSSGSRDGWNITHDADELIVIFKDGSASYKINSGMDLADAKWHHIVLTYDVSGSQTSTLYIDGTESGTIETPAITIADAPLRIGKSVDSFWSDFEGSVDEFRIWDHVKSPGEIGGLALNRSDGTEDGLILVLNFDEPEGSTEAYEGTKNNFDGEISGDVTFHQREIASISAVTPINVTDPSTIGTDIDPFDVSGEEISPWDVAFSTDGTKMFITGRGGRDVSQYSLSVPFDLSSEISYDGDPYPLGYYVTSFHFKQDGTRMFAMESSYLYQYDLENPFDITEGVSQNGSPFTLFGNGVTFNNDGSKFYIVGNNIHDVMQYSLSAPFDITSTVTLDGTLDIEKQGALMDIAFNANGTRMFIMTVGYPNPKISQFYLSTPFDITSSVIVDEKTLDISADFDNPRGLTFSPAGTELYVTGMTKKWVKQYDITPSGFIETEKNDGSVYGPIIFKLENETFINAGSTLVEDDNYQVTGIPAGFTPVMTVNAEGTMASFTLTGTVGDHENANDISELQFSFGNSAFTGGYAARVTDATQINSGMGIDFNDNNPPEFDSYHYFHFNENSTGEVTDVDAHNGDNGENDDGITYSLGTDGEDEGFFDIDENTGILSFTIIPDYENPLDGDGDNLYLVEVLADDGGVQNNTASQVITVEIENMDDDPIFTSVSTASINENSTEVILDVNANDGDGNMEDEHITYSIEEMDDHGLFNIDPDIGHITFTNPPDYENPSDTDTDNHYGLTVTAFDGYNSTSQSITIEVLDLNDNDPIITADQIFVINENAANSTSIGTIAATDGDAGTSFEAWTITDGNPDNVFAIDASTGELTVNDNTQLDYETNENFVLTLTVSDGTNTSDTETVSIQVNDLNDNAPVITSEDNIGLEENLLSVLTLTASDADAGSTLTFSISGGSDQNAFSIEENTGEVSFLNAPDFENPADADADNQYIVQVTASDGTYSSDQTITIVITDLNDENPVFTSADVVEIPENSVAVQTVAATDADHGDEITLTLTGGEDMTLFGFDVNTGALSFLDPPDFENPIDSDGDNGYQVEVTATDNADHSTIQTLTIIVTQVNENPIVVHEISDFELTEGFIEHQLDMSGVFEDEDGDELIFSATSDDESTVTVNISGENMIITETGTGSATITVTAGDGNGGMVADEFMVTISEAPVNHPPVVDNPVNDQTFDEGFGTSEIDLTGTFTDPDEDELTLAAESSNENVVSVTISGTILTLSEMGAGTANILLTANDGNGGEISDEFTVIVAAGVLGVGTRHTDLIIYPQPAGQYLKLKTGQDHHHDIRKLSIYDLSGQLKIEKAISTSEEIILDISGLNPNTYLLRIEDAETTITKKFIKL